jgi:iron(III) transport system ATP-binding protein
MQLGKIIQQGSPEQVYTSPLSAITAMSTGDALVLTANKLSDGRTDYIFNPITSPTEIAEVGQVVIRPEEIKISHDLAFGKISGQITKIDYYGHDAMVAVKVNDQVLQVRIPGPLDFAVGQQVGLDHQGPLRFFAAI